MAVGCSTQGPARRTLEGGTERGLARESLGSNDTRGLQASERYLSEQGSGGTGGGPEEGRPAAMIDGAALAWDRIAGALSEAAGREVMEEVALEAGLSRRFERAGLRLDDAMLERERALFEAAALAGGVSGQDARSLLERVRRERGLGPTRFRALLRRNAMLRALVSDQVVLNEAALRQAYELTYGESLRARVIVTATARDAGEAARRVGSGEAFSKVAGEMSTDASGPRGGTLEPFSGADPAYPAALRDTLARMSPGEVSGPIVLGGADGFAVVTLDERTRPNEAPAFEDCRAEMEEVSRRRQERLLMEQLAREVRAAVKVRALDPSLRWAAESE